MQHWYNTDLDHHARGMCHPSGSFHAESALWKNTFICPRGLVVVEVPNNYGNDLHGAGATHVFWVHNSKDSDGEHGVTLDPFEPVLFCR